MHERDEADGIDGPAPSGTVGREDGGPVDSLQQWLLLDGNRLVVAALLTALVGLVVLGLIRAGYAQIGSGSQLPTLLGSGLTSGLLTLVTVALSINQLILSRVFGSPSELDDSLSGVNEFRDTVEDIADVPASPNDPAKFIALVGTTMHDRAERLRSELDDPTPEFEDYLDRIESFADGLVDARTKSDSTVQVLSSLLGPGYADNMVVTDRLHDEYDVSEAASEELTAVRRLLGAVAVTRQFFKTVAIQQDLARLSRMLVYFGVIALLAVFALTLSYSTSVVSISPSYRPYAVAVGLAVIVTPLMVLVSYMLRVATVALYSVSVGPFVPPEERG